MNSCKKHEILDLYTTQEPYTFDPIEYDFGVHHVTERAVLASLISNYKKGGYVGQLAQEWSSDNDFKKWTFHLFENAKFDDETPVTSRVVEQSIKRIAFIMKKRHSEDNFTNYLIGYESFNKISDNLPGLKILDSSTIEFNFTKSIPDFLEEISFGIFAIVHPDDYNHETGEWKNPNSAKASGLYSIKNVSKDGITLTLRKNHPLADSRHFNEIFIHWNKEKKQNADVIMGSSFDKEELENSYELVAPIKASIIYGRCVSWTHKDSIFHSRENRQLLRDLYYKQLTDNGYIFSHYFFPREISKQDEEQNNKDLSLANKPIPENIKNIPLRVHWYAKNFEKSHIHFVKSFEQISSAKKIKYAAVGPFGFDKVRANKKEKLAQYEFDWTQFSTDVEHPEDTVRFMFLSAEGVQLPDEDGSIRAELDKKPINIAKINALINKQALVWPLGHYRSGIWIKKAVVDISDYNSSLPPIDFTWIYRK